MVKIRIIKKETTLGSKWYVIQKRHPFFIWVWKDVVFNKYQFITVNRFSSLTTAQTYVKTMQIKVKNEKVVYTNG